MKYISNRNNWEVVLHNVEVKDGFCLARASNTERFSLVHYDKEFYRIFKDGKPFFDDCLFLFEPYTIRKAENKLNENRFVFCLRPQTKVAIAKTIYFLPFALLIPYAERLLACLTMKNAMKTIMQFLKMCFM